VGSAHLPFGHGLGRREIVASDVYDVLALAPRVLGIPIGAAARPTQYALICEQPGVQTEADNVVNEEQVRHQLAYQSGDAYNTMRTHFREG
jgi:hypothetical protein